MYTTFLVRYQPQTQTEPSVVRPITAQTRLNTQYPIKSCYQRKKIKKKQFIRMGIEPTTNTFSVRRYAAVPVSKKCLYIITKINGAVDFKCRFKYYAIEILYF